VVINQSHGTDFLAPYRELYPHILLRDLPELEELQSMINDLPLEFVSFQSDSSAYLAALEVRSGWWYFFKSFSSTFNVLCSDLFLINVHDMLLAYNFPTTATKY
jgi:hypothetical protein